MVQSPHLGASKELREELAVPASKAAREIQELNGHLDGKLIYVYIYIFNIYIHIIHIYIYIYIYTYV